MSHFHEIRTSADAELLNKQCNNLKGGIVTSIHYNENALTQAGRIRGRSVGGDLTLRILVTSMTPISTVELVFGGVITWQDAKLTLRDSSFHFTNPPDGTILWKSVSSEEPLNDATFVCASKAAWRFAEDAPASAEI